jgi:Uma2 family endonuclease
MSALAVEIPQLVTGMRMTPEEFLATWEQLPDLKHAELIDGVVYVSSPVSFDHSEPQNAYAVLFGIYCLHTPDCQSGFEATWSMVGSIPQPDVFLRRRPAHGGQSKNGPKYYEGAPELAVEVCVTSTSHDFGPKLALYRRAEVREYVTVETLTQKIRWRALEGGIYIDLEPDSEGVFRSREFPGLWFDSTAFWADDMRGMMATLEKGLASRPA